MVNRLNRLYPVLALGLLLAPMSAFAAAATSFGPRIGISVDPDQFVVGGQLAVGEVAPSLSFDPNLELGFGDDQTVIAMNLDLHYHFAVSGSDWRPYVGMGAGINFFEFDQPPPAKDDTETEAGANVILGAGVPTKSGNQFFTEMKFGLGDIPSLKLIAGWNFRM